MAAGNGIAPRILDICHSEVSFQAFFSTHATTTYNIQSAEKKSDYHEGLHKVKGRVRDVSICIIIPTVVNSVHLQSRVVARAGICLYYMWV